MKQFNVTGMTCASCSARVEKAVTKLDGVKSCNVNLLTNSMTVDSELSDDIIINAVKSVGYGASVKGKATVKEKTENSDNLKFRLISSVIVLLVLMYFSMGYKMWNWPVPSFLDKNYIAIAIVQMLLTIVIMVINRQFFISGVKSVLKGSPNMDTLVSLGAGAAFIYSLYSLFLMTLPSANQHHLLHEMYFESSAMILTLITVGKKLEDMSKGRTTDALKSLMQLAPKTANLIVDGKEITVSAEEVKIGDIFVVRPGESIPVDAVVIEGESAVNESALTGESIPVDKTKGDNVYSATLNQSGFLKCKATKVGEDTTLSKIIKMVSDASASKAPIAKVADKVSGIFVPTVIIIAVVTFVVWLLLDYSLGFSLARAISVLVISCPCALGLATPVAIMVGSGVGAKKGILFKSAESLEETGRVKTVILDKTGTITKGEPTVTDIVAFNDFDNKKLLSFAYSIEDKSEHPLATAVVDYAVKNGIEKQEVRGFTSVLGNGLECVLDKKKLITGNINFINQFVRVDNSVISIADNLSNEGKTPLYFAYDKQLIGIIAVADVIKEDSKQAIKSLKNMKIDVVMLTGDNKKTANAIANAVGVDEVVAEVLPDKKQETIRDYKAKSKVAMVGDGINDAPALTSADVGIAIGSGTDVAIDAADVVLMKNGLFDVVTAIKLSKATLRNIHENLFWAFIYNLIGIPLAAGVFINIFGWQLNPMFGAAAMSLSSFCVVTNALRLNLFKSNKKEKVKKVKYQLKIEGMMCSHCEMRVKEALQAVNGVSQVEVSHKKGEAIVVAENDDLSDALKNTVIAQGYKVL